eukprot:CCRYP_017509-RA/>CCRYP_017509-RA protein AED:0.04 eAED:0.04 QI:113/0.83/0.71/1/0.66/0.57/7/1872/973
MSSLRDEAFSLLKEAEELEREASNQDQSPPSDGQATGEGKGGLSNYCSRLEESSKKYHEACYLMKRLANNTLNGVSPDATKMRTLLADKIEHYEHHAEYLIKKVKAYRDQAKSQTTENDSDRKKNSFAFEHNDSPISSWENNHSSRLDAASHMMPNAQNAFDNDKSSGSNNEAAVRTAGKASLLLSSAIALDENEEFSTAIEQYLSSAHFYLEAVKALSEDSKTETSVNRVFHEARSNNDLIASLKRKVKMTLDRVEELKKKGPLNNTNGRDYIDLHSKVGQKSSDVNDKLKNLASSHESTQHQLSQDEIDVLLRSSLIASGVFLPWKDEEAQSYNYFSSAPSSWVDPDGLLILSDRQKERFYKWARPDEILNMREGATSSPLQIKMVHSITPFTIKQHCVSDCSFVACLCIAAAYERRFNKRLITSLIYPQDSSGFPIYNPHGVYMVKLWLNGVARRVLVDDLLPVDATGSLLCSHTTSMMSGSKRNLLNDSSLELWVSILEKAYMKLCGGYNFPGSNSGIDLFSLTGWIPERIFFPEDASDVKDFETPVERAWERLYRQVGLLSTSKELTEEKAAEVGLFTAHAYAVLGVIQTTNGTRLLQLKNPWASQGWKGKYSSNDKVSWSDPNFCAEVGYDAHSASIHDDGVFYISWDDVLIYFRNLHLSWNPALFHHKTTMHGLWNKELGPADDSFNIGENPQYIVNLSKNAIDNHATLWILLTRHVTKQEQEGGEVSNYLTLHIHRITSSKRRVWYPGGTNCVLTGAYTNNQHILIRYDVEGPSDKHLSIVLSQYKKSNDLCYTLSCYCTEPFNLSRPEDPLPFCCILKGSWELRDSTTSEPQNSLLIGTAGGPPGKGSFGSNPQWSLVVEQETFIQLKCMTQKSLAVNVVVVQTGFASSRRASGLQMIGKRVHHLYEAPIVDSGDYRYGFVVTERVLLPPGSYTIVVSTFEVGELGSFILHVMSDNQVDIEAMR